MSWRAAPIHPVKAIRVETFGPPEVMQLRDLPDPLPAPGQVLVRLHACGVNPVDTYIRSGQYARKPALPCTPGLDGAGVIESLGADVRGLQLGERVYVAGSLTGTYAQLALCEAQHVHPLPAAASFAQGAALGVPYGTAHFALFDRAAARSGETVLIHGASGGVGTAAVQVARAAGLTVFGTAGTEAGRRLVLEQGAHEVFDHTAPDCSAQILAKTGGRGVDVIVEMLANKNLNQDLSLLAPGGRIAVVGSRGSVEIDPRDLMARNADIRGVLLFGAPPAALAAIHRAIVRGIESGALRPVIACELPLAEAARAHHTVLAPGARGKIVLTPPGVGRPIDCL